MHAPARQPVPAATPQPDPVESASAAGLRYVSDQTPGIRRRRAGSGFTYLDAQGRPLRDAQTLSRIRSLAIPPAWSDVWICPTPLGHLQASGRDQKGRKQYRYHPRWRQVRDDTKFSRMVAFARALPRIRGAVDAQLNKPGLSREKVLALVVKLLELTLIRVGNDEYAKQNGSFGLTTLRDRHVEVKGSRAAFRFRGKAGKAHRVELSDKRLAQLIKRCQDLPGQELFQYEDEKGEPRSIRSEDVNEYLRTISGQDFTAKDFRTWAATVLAAWMLQELEPFQTARQAKQNVIRAIERVAERLGNTPTICRKCYVHPAVIQSYMEGSLLETLKQKIEREMRALPGLPPQEAVVVTLLTRRLREEEARRGSQPPARTKRVPRPASAA
jgi:DNA topoisomerase-1